MVYRGGRGSDEKKKIEVIAGDPGGHPTGRPRVRSHRIRQWDRLVYAGDRAHDVELCFFFQAEDGIRAFHVTGVQTCALPISRVCLLELRAARRRPAEARAL